jgi:hypothetical protein
VLRISITTKITKDKDSASSARETARVKESARERDKNACKNNILYL